MGVIFLPRCQTGVYFFCECDALGRQDLTDVVGRS
jgi:hypothetical protein